jgi:hypothetical protein
MPKCYSRSYANLKSPTYFENYEQSLRVALDPFGIIVCVPPWAGLILPHSLFIFPTLKSLPCKLSQFCTL